MNQQQQQQQQRAATGGPGPPGASAEPAGQQQQQQKKQRPEPEPELEPAPARHPILDRLENNDYDFNGQSLDYEPNLEFDDTDLKQELEEELEQLHAADFLALNGHLYHHQQQGAPAHESATSPSAASSARAGTEAGSPATDEERADGVTAASSDDSIFLEQLESQLSLHQSRVAYLESPHDLLEENFEEAFKSSLFELERKQAAHQQAQQQLKSKRNLNRLLFGKQGRTGSGGGGGAKLSLPTFLRSKFGGGAQAANSHSPGAFYAVNKQGALDNSLEGLHLDTRGAWNRTGRRVNDDEHYADRGENDHAAAADDDDYDDDEDDDDDDDDDDFSDIAQYNCVESAGDDLFGRRIITIYACRLPSATRIHHLRLLKYIMYTLDQYVENDYCVVYFHYGLNSQNKPHLNFLYQAYRAFDRKYKKNLKALFLVHPTNFIRIVWQLFKPIISIKFGRKMRYVNYLNELEQFMHLEQLLIPKQVLEHDKRVLDNVKTKPSWLYSKPAVQPSSTWHRRLDSQQFRVSLKFIKEHNNGDPTPPVVRRCIDYLSSEAAMQTEGLFRRSANTKTVLEVQELLNSGEEVNFDDYGPPEQAVHVAAVILKTFLRELEEPILTFGLFGEITSFKNHHHHNQTHWESAVGSGLGSGSGAAGAAFARARGATYQRDESNGASEQHQLISSAKLDANNQLTYELTSTSTPTEATTTTTTTTTTTEPSAAAVNGSASDDCKPKSPCATYLSQIDANRIRLELAKVLVLQRLPEDNYKLLKLILKFLCQIIDRKDLNKMTSANLAIVFGPNLLWSKDKCASLASISAINYFTEFLLDNYKSIFVK